MPLKLRIYLDTSVFSAYLDERSPERRAQTAEFWKRLHQYEFSTSELARVELSRTPDLDHRGKLLKLLEGFTIHRNDSEMKELAQHYIASEVFMPPMADDALHVAAAVMTRQDVLVSWNFKHLVNRRRRALVNQLNTARGLPTIEIAAPPEI
jgi:predicted nucleic acid-binding protein